MTIFEGSTISRDSDVPCRFNLTRPDEATYDLGSAEIRMAIKRISTNEASIFEASTSPTDYRHLDGTIKTQAGITLTAQSVNAIAGNFIIPAESAPRTYFRAPSQRAFYTFWIIVDGLELVRESGYVNIVQSAIAK